MLKEDLKDSQEQAERYKMKMAEQNSELLLANEQKKQLEELCEKLDGKVKETSHEYIIRLERYIEDVKEFVWHREAEAENEGTQKSLKQLQNMVDGLKQAYKADKEIVERKVVRVTSYMNEILQRHEQLLTAYKLIMWKTGIGSQTDESIERDFAITLPPIEDIKSEQMKERNDLKTKLYLSEQNVKDLNEKIDKLKDRLKEARNDKHEERDTGGGDVSFKSLRKDMRNFTVNVQLELEQERAQLLTRCTLAEQQVAEYEEFMETYIRRYQQEIMKLRKMLSEAGRAHSADGALGLEYRGPRPLPPLQDDKKLRTRYMDMRY